MPTMSNSGFAIGKPAIERFLQTYTISQLHILFKNRALGIEHVKKAKMIAMLLNEDKAIQLLDVMLHMSKRQKKQIRNYILNP